MTHPDKTARTPFQWLFSNVFHDLRGINRPIMSVLLVPALLVLMLGSGLVACAGNPNYQNVSVQALHSALQERAAEPNRIVLDVRTPQEFAEGHVAGAKLIPVQKLETRVNEVPDNAPVYVICRSGNRSKTAADLLARNGKTDVRNVQGGTLAWQAAGYPVER